MNKKGSIIGAVAVGVLAIAGVITKKVIDTRKDDSDELKYVDVSKLDLSSAPYKVESKEDGTACKEV